MTPTEPELRETLAEIEDPANGEDIVSMGLVNDVTIADGTAEVSLAFNAPYASAEIEIGNAIRDAVEEAGLEPDLHAHVGEEHGFDEEILPGVRNVIAVASGKGGVGKTTVAANLAAGLDELGARVGLLDADVHGPNAPRILPTDEQPGVTGDNKIVPPESEGVAVISTDHLLPDSDEPAILRGPMVTNVMMKFIDEVEWGHRDYLVVDLPPGTGDASLNLLQTLPVAGAIIVTTPQEMAIDDAKKSLHLFEEHDAPVAGVVENMSSFRCPNCEDDHRVFGTTGVTEDFEAPVLAQLPVHPEFGSERTDGPIVRHEESPLDDEIMGLVESVADRIGEINRRRVAANVGDGTQMPDESVPDASAE
jgi:ATP-binding protein involved in chromosome partitioning